MIDLVIFIAALVVIAIVSILASRGEATKAQYFLAGRKLTWWLIGISLIASNISTEHFVGMTGNAARSGLAVASYEWLAVIALIVVAWWLLPVFLRAGIYTIPEFLEYRYDRTTRSILAALMVVFFVLTVLATVLYGGAMFLVNVFQIDLLLQESWSLSPESAGSRAFMLCVWGIGLAAGVYTIIGGLGAVVWSDLLQGLALLAGGLLVFFLALDVIGDGEGIFAGWRHFAEVNEEKLHVVRPWNDSEMPSLSLVTGLWIPVLFYWGLNQFIVQRTLAAGSLAQGQKGILFAAAIKLILPFIVVLPGIMAVQILGDDYDPQNADAAYPTLIRELLPAGVLGLMLAAVAGAVLSTFNSGLNSAATVFTLDLWGTHVDPDMDDRRTVRVGRITTTVLAIAACLWAPVIHGFDGVFSYIQEIWGFVSAPTCAIFFMGLLVARVPASAAKTALVVGPILYLISRSPTWMMTADDAIAAGGSAQFLFDYASMSFLYHMFIIFIVLVTMLWIWSVFAPGPARPLPRRDVVEMAPMRGLAWVSMALLLAVTGLYVVFW
ncbi:MAG TPA: solute:sodium symporter family transporter [Phycisphaerales bacterium]|nr:solute:sodium symporter family transporter [Phycisphaerales bacterium]